MFDVVYGCSKLVHPRDQQEFIHSVPKIAHEGGKKIQEAKRKMPEKLARQLSFAVGGR